MAAKALPANLVRLSDIAEGRQERLLPVPDVLVPLLTQPGLTRGSELAVKGPGALTLATALAAEVSRTGGWVAAVGLGRMGISAVDERTASLERWAFIDKPGDAAAEVLSALIGNIDVILLDSNLRLSTAQNRRLRARLRERGSVMIGVGEAATGTSAAGPAATSAKSAVDPDVTFTVKKAAWVGLRQGHGRLAERRAEVVAVGRGAASLPRQAVLWLPDVNGCVTAVDNAITTGGNPTTTVGNSMGSINGSAIAGHPTADSTATERGNGISGSGANGSGASNIAQTNYVGEVAVAPLRRAR